MPNSLQEIVDRAAQIAESVAGANFSVDEPTVELLLPHVLQNVILNARSNGGKLKSLIKTHEVEITNGVGALPARVVPEFFSSAQIIPEDGDHTFVSYLAEDFDLSLPQSSNFNYYSIRGGEIHYLNTASNAPESETIRVRAVTSPLLPGTASGELDLADDLIDDLVIELARAIRGEAPYMNLASEEKDQ